MKRHILAIIPTYNEADNIGPVLEELLKIKKQSKNFYLDILIVDDNSPDGTSKIVKKYKKNNEDISLITGQKNGLGDAYIRGIKHSIKNDKYYAIVMMDADFSHDPKVIPELVNKLYEGYDCVLGSRYTKHGFIPGTWPIKRIINSKVANYLAKLFGGFDDNVTDFTGGFKIIKVDSFRAINLDKIKASGYFFQVGLLYALTENQSKITEIPISFSDRERGNSKIAYSDIFEFLYKMFSLNPNSKIRRILNFILVGAFGVIVNLIALTILLKVLNINPILSDAIAIELSIISNYYFNNRYTFKNSIVKNSIIINVGKFNLVALAGALISLSIFSVLYKFAHINYVIADLIAIAISVTWNYWGSTRFIWKDADGIS